MEEARVGLVLAFFAGLLSFASPCVLPLVPAYLGLLAGRSVGVARTGPIAVLGQAASFVAGFSLVFVLWGASATAVGKMLGRLLPWVQRLGGIFLFLLGLHLMGLLRLSFLYRLRLPLSPPLQRPGYLAPFLAGVFFFAGWVPCVGPVLAAILLLASNSRTVLQGGVLLAVYSLGLGIPFLVLALFAGSLARRLRGASRFARVVELASGVMVAGIGLAILADWLAVLARYSSWFAL